MQQEFNAVRMAAAVERLVVPTLLRGKFATAAREVHAIAEDQHATLSDTSQVDCGPGCDCCCVVNVSVLAPEADAIVDYLQQSLPVESLTLLHAKLNALYLHTQWLDDEERIMSNYRCAFLDEEGCCMVYPVRPLLCRGLTSTSADDCRTAIAMLAMGEQHPIASCLVQKEIFDAAFVGLGQALKTCGLDDRSFRLSGAVLNRLNE